MKTVAVVTVGRSDFGIYLPVLHAIESNPLLQLRLIAGGAHLTGAHGNTLNDIHAHQFEIAEQVDMLLASDRPAAIGQSTGIGLAGFAAAFERVAPDLVLVLGDRFEMHAAASAAAVMGLPLAHIHGGETTEGAIDELLRHSITKLSHLHFVTTAKARQRVIQMGEEPWRVTVTGAPALDRVADVEPWTRERFEANFGISLRSPSLIVTFHPVTLELEALDDQLGELLDALGNFEMQQIVTFPNADARYHEVLQRLQDYAATRDFVHLVSSLGADGYFSLMRHADAMVGNSSSGIIEAASFDLPVVNIGNRQRGRERGANVIDVDDNSKDISEAIANALSPEMQTIAKQTPNPYGSGNAAKQIASLLAETLVDRKLLQKRFYSDGATQ